MIPGESRKRLKSDRRVGIIYSPFACPRVDRTESKEWWWPGLRWLIVSYVLESFGRRPPRVVVVGTPVYRNIYSKLRVI